MAILVGTAHELGVEPATLCDFYSRNWARRIALMQESFYTWQFKLAPDGSGDDHCVIAMDSDSREVAGIMGLNPRAFSLNGKTIKGAELTTWVVSENYRKTGAGAKILSHILASYDVLIGMGISAMALPVYVRSGFRYLVAIPRFVRAYNFDNIEKIARVDRVALKADAAWRSKYTTRSYTEVGYSAELSDRITSAFAQNHNFFSRDARHIEWRYSNHPAFEYQKFIVRDESSGEHALIVIRLEDAIEGFTLCHVMDVIGSDQATAAAFSFIDDLCTRIGVDAADFYCTSSSVNKHPLGAGWFSIVDDKYFEFPHLFHPLELRPVATTSLIYWARENLSEMCDFSRLYITKQDADFDRPTLKG